MSTVKSKSKNSACRVYCSPNLVVSPEQAVQGLLLTTVLAQNYLTMPPALADKSPIIRPGGGSRGDEAATAATAAASGRDWPRQNGLRRQGYPSPRGSHQQPQPQLQAEQERIPYAPVSSRNHRHQQEWRQESRKLDITEGHPELSFEPEIPEDGSNSLPQIYQSPHNANCPVALHVSNSAVLREDRENAEPPTTIVGAFSVWARLQEALNISSQLRCPSPPCCLGTHLHTYRGGDLGEEMSHIQGAVVVRRPDLAWAPGSLAPAHDLDFVKTFQSYFPISQNSLLRRFVEADGFNLTSETKHVKPTFKTLLGVDSFLGGVREGNSAAAELLTPYCSGEDPRQDISDCVRIPTVVSMADAYTNKRGAVWNKKDYIMPLNCQGPVRHEVSIARKIAAEGLPRDPERYDKVFVMAQEWSPNYYHFTAEHLPRITLMLDVLLDNPDIIISMHFYEKDIIHENISAVHEVQMEMLEILGISRERVVLVDQQMHANLAIIPTSTVCGDPDPHMVNMLRNRFLQGLFPTTNGVPPAPPRPTIVLVVRTTLRGLQNNEEVKEALKISFPSFDVVEFFGTDPVGHQFKTFATAAMIVAPHGAGLANIIVAPLHTPVLEIAPISCPPCFLRLALKLHHIYARHPGDHWSQECMSWYEPPVDEIIELARDLLEAKRLADDALIPLN
ncbi:unnamed protein product [Ectocarpus sp. CCAP 1310/34]|nr:unnamed protein product [Ectocarpus sp. CCAP 1310/34]